MSAWILNLVIPGVGLIVRRREWLGVSLAVLFGAAVNLALVGWLIAPLSIPYWLTWTALTMAVLTWLWAQALFARQVSRRAARERAVLIALSEIRAAIERGDEAAARLSAEQGLAIDDEDVELSVHFARLASAGPDERAAEKAWRRVLTLNGHGPHRDEAAGALRALARRRGDAR